MKDVTSHAGGHVKAIPWSKPSLPLLLLLSFAISVGLGVYALVTLRSVLVYERGVDLARTAEGVADTIDRVLFERFGDIQLFSTDATIRSGNLEQTTDRLMQYKRQYWYYSWIGVTDAAGRIIAATDFPPSRNNGELHTDSKDSAQAVTEQDWFERVRATGQVYFGEPKPSPESGDVSAVSFSAPIRGVRGEFRGVVTSRIPIDHVRPIIEKEVGMQSVRAAYDWLVMNHHGTVISQKHRAEATVKPQTLQMASAIKAAEDRDKSGFVEEIDPDRHVRVVTGYARTHGYEAFPGFDWTILMRVDHDVAYASINHLIIMVGGVCLLVLTPMAGFGIWASWKLIQEDRALAEASQALEQSVAELTRSNADLQQFAYVASHDLQEPLRMVASYTQLLSRRYKGKLDADADEFIGYAVEGANRMQQLIKDLLAYSRVTTRGAFEPLETDRALEAALANLHMAIEKERAVVTHDPLPRVVADGTQLTQLFQNLVSNALKFHGDRPPRVHISAVQRGDEWVFAVRDDGIGIDPQYADRIFVIFQRLHTSAEYPGTGIGLALCKKIVERHGGRIWVESHVGHGATFYFTMPFVAHDSLQETVHHDGKTH